MKLNIDKKIKVGAPTYISTKNKNDIILKEGETIAIVNLKEGLSESSADYDARINDQRIMIQKIKDRISALNKEPASSTKTEKIQKLNDEVKAHEKRIADYNDMKKAASSKEASRKKESESFVEVSKNDFYKNSKYNVWMDMPASTRVNGKRWEVIDNRYNLIAYEEDERYFVNTKIVK